MNKQTFLLLILSFQICNLAIAQNETLINNEALHFQITDKNQNIDFVLFDTVLTQRKPVFLFCQGSLPIPLFFELNDGSVFTYGGGISNFDISEIKEYYHLIVISMPETPIYAKQSELNNRYQYVPDTAKPEIFKTEYLEADYLDNYVNRAESVIKYLQKQKWVDNEKLIVFGHSQGSHIATKLASNPKNNISHIGLSGANFFGRIDQSVRQIRKDENSGLISATEAEKRINEEYEQLKASCNKEYREQYPYLIAWYSFSQPTIDDLLKIDIPIYLTYGTNDITADLCELIPLYFILENKDNLTIKRRWGLEHNYFELDEKGNMNVEKGHWAEVMSEFLSWIK
jgi:hypothetical protein